MTTKTISTLAAMLLIAGIASPVFAQTSPASTTPRGAGARATLSANAIAQAKARADQEITRRLNALTALTARVNDMQKLSADEKSGLAATIQSQIGEMNGLEAQIAADASSSATSSLKADIQSITKSYRIYMLVIPQGALDAAADRAMTIAGSMNTLAGKLQTRIASTSAETASSTASMQAALADMNVKDTDAVTQAQAAVSEVTGLQPDNGNQTVMQSNTAALKDARAKIKAAQQDLVAARKDAGTIVKALINTAAQQ